MPQANKRKRTKSVARSYKKRKTAGLGPTSFAQYKKTPLLDRAAYTKSVVVYSDYARSLNPALSSVETYVYSLNGLYDPDITGVGGQPTGFDQYMALYGSYTVLKAMIHVACINTDNTNQAIVGVNVAGLPTTSTDGNVYLRNNNMWHQTLDIAGSGACRASYSFEVDMNKLVTQDVWSDDKFAGTVNTNPANQWYLFIWNGPANSLANNGEVTWTVKIEYLAAFREPINTSNS